MLSPLPKSLCGSPAIVHSTWPDMSDAFSAELDDFLFSQKTPSIKAAFLARHTLAV